MTKILTILALITLLISCKNNNESKVENSNQTTETATEKSTVENTTTNEINWNEMPDLKDIGNFPFVTAPQGLKIENEKDGLSEIFDFETMEVYNGKEVSTVEGKLGILGFDGADDKDFNQKIFDRNVLPYFDKIGAKKLYTGDFPKDEKMNDRLDKNMYSGKHSTNGLLNESDAPFSVYAFKNNGKKYVLYVQSNSAQGNIFIMELKDFEQTITKFTSKQMLDDINAKGKAILNINFDMDKSTLKPDGQVIVDEIVKLMKENPNLKISIEGHTDNTGSADRNKKLSSERATSVLNSLVGSGISKTNLKAVGFGSEKPMTTNDTEENKAKNRRVELVKF